MPRPKRTKVASTAAPTRVAKPSKPAAPAKQSQKAAITSDRADNLSDDSDGLVVKRSRPRRRMPWQPAPQKDVDLTMTGALPASAQSEEEDEGIRNTPTYKQSPKDVMARNNRPTPSSNASRKTRTAKNSKQAIPQQTPQVNPRSVTSIAQSPIMQEDESSLLDPSLITFGSLDSESPAHGTRPPSAMKVGGTPAHETSILALTNFRRRARQPSLLRMVHQTTDVEDNDPDDLDDLDDFHPEDESTPLHVRKGVGSEEANESSGLSLSSTSSRGKKRKLSSPVVQVPRSSPPYDPPSGADVTNSQHSASPSLLEDMIESREDVLETQEQSDPEIMSETMAPPMSSSELGDEIENSPERPRARRKRGTSRKKNMSESEGEETDRPVRSGARHRPKMPTMSTAKLQALLPRRRTRMPQEHDEYDFQSSDDIHITTFDSDQDELQLPPLRKSAPVRSTKKVSRPVKKSMMPPETAKKNTRTYSRRTSSDKENESTFVANEDSVDVDEPSTSSIDVPKSKLAAITKKFEDVDAWEMDFESVDVGGVSSSPWR